MGSKIVRAEICSDVAGSKRITSPLPFPDHLLIWVHTRYPEEGPTKSYISIPHPGRHSKGFKRSESRDFAPGVQIPYDRRLTDIVADDKTASSSFTDIVDTYERDLFLMATEALVDRQRVMMQTHNHRTLRVQ
jgi:hypothetical protein